MCFTTFLKKFQEPQVHDFLKDKHVRIDIWLPFSDFLFT